MSEVISNLKVKFGADSSNFKKGMNEGSQAMKEFTGTAGNAFDQFAAAFGINMQGIRDGMTSVKNSILGLGTAATTGAANAGIFTRSLQVLKTAIAATGIGALVLALTALVSYFTKTQRGADMVSQAMSALKAITDVIRDRFSALGETIVNAFRNPAQAVADLWEAIKTNIVNRFKAVIDLFGATGGALQALFKGDLPGLKAAAGEAATALVQLGTGLDSQQQANFAASVRGLVTEIKEEGKAAAQLTKIRQQLRDQEINLMEVQAKRRKEINQARLLAKDETVSAQERLKAIQRAVELENITLEENLALQRQRIQVTQAEVDLGESMAEDMRKLAQERTNLHDLESSSLLTQRRLATEVRTLTREIEAETAAIMKQREELTAQTPAMDSIKLSATLETPTLETDKLKTWAEDQKAVLSDVQRTWIDFQDIFNNSMNGVVEGFATGIGEMIAGTGSLKDVGALIGSLLGDMLINLGRATLAAGMASLGISAMLKAAFASPAGAALAIAAGAAAIAVGTALKSSLSKVATGAGGGSGAYSSGAGGSYDVRGTGITATGNRPQTAITVEVTGQTRINNDHILISYQRAAQRKKINT